MLKKADAEVLMHPCCGGSHPWKVLHEARGTIRGFYTDQKRSKQFLYHCVSEARGKRMRGLVVAST